MPDRTSRIGDRPGHRPVAARRTNRPRIGKRALIGWGCGVAIASVAATVGMLQIYPPPEPVPDAWTGSPRGDSARPYVMVLATASNREFLASTGGEYDRHIDMWCRAYRDAGADVEVVSSPAAWVEAVESGGGAVLAAPFLLCGSDAEMATLMTTVDMGGGLILSGPIGVRDAEGKWIGWDRMHAILGSSEIRELPPDQALFMTLGAAPPLGPMGWAGARFALHKREPQWGLRGLGEVAYWSDYSRNPTPPESGSWASICAAPRGRGRIAWLGFEPELVSGSDGAYMREVLARLVEHCSATPIAALDLWPREAETVLLICEDTEQDFENARHLDRILSERGVRGTFMCVSNLARMHADLVARIAKRHDIGSHSDDHRTFSGQEVRRQLSRLRRSGNDLARLTGRPTLGFRPPEEGHDEATLRALAGAGYGYILGNIDASRPLPEALRFRTKDGEARDLVRVPRMQADDFEFVARRGLNDSEILEILARDLDTARRLRCVDFVSLHTHLLGSPERIGVVADFLDSIDRRGLWITGADSLALWWSCRNRAEIATDGVPGGIVVRLANPGPTQLDGARLVVLPPGNPRRLEIAGAVHATLEAAPDGSVRIPLPTVPAGGAIELRLRPAAASRGIFASIR